MILASAVLSIPNAMLAVAKEIEADTFNADIRRLGMKEDVVYLAVNELLRDRINGEIWDEVEANRQKILTGELIVPKGF